MKNQNIIITAIIAIALLSGGFYSGMQYGVNKASKAQVSQGGRNGGNFAGGTAGGQRGAGQGMQNGAGVRQGGMQNGGAGDFAAGEIISKDDTSVTVKMRDGSSKIVFFSTSTGIDKSVSGSGNDLSIGQQVTVNGKTGSDGSITAQNIQIRPLLTTQPAK